LVDIFFDDAGDIAGLKRMEVEGILRRDNYGLAKGRFGLYPRGVDCFVSVAFSHKTEGKKRFLPSRSADRNVAL
jgi:hypothetical protein